MGLLTAWRRCVLTAWAVVASPALGMLLAQSHVDPNREAELEAIRRNALKYQYLQDAYYLVKRKFHADEFSAPDGTVLHIVLTRFQFFDEYKDLCDDLVIDTFAAMVRRQWNEKLSQGTPKDVVKRLHKQHTEGHALGGARAAGLHELRTKYEKIADKPWPFDWQRNEQRWTAVAKALIESLAADDPAPAWRRLIEADADNARFCQAAYLGVLRGRKDVDVDMRIVSAYVKSAKNNAHRLRRLTEALASVAAACPDVNDPARSRLRKDV